MTTVLVTGGAGFIGSHIVDLLLEEDFEIIVLDNLSTGKESNLPSTIKFEKGDITSSKDVSKALMDVEIICHFAAQASVAISMKQVIFDANVNVLGTLQLLKQAWSKEIDQFIYSSTGGAIYGNPKELPVPETHPEGPVSIYGTSKLAAEKYIDYYRRQGLKTSILRLANIYGPRQDPNGEAGVISIFLGNILQNKPLHIYGDGTSSRDYVYVQDVAKIVYDIIRNPIHGPINIATGKQVFLMDLVNIILQVTNSSPRIIHEKERPGDVKNIYLDSSLLKNHLDWFPNTSLKDGIQEVWNWVKKPIY
ncbi:MAG: NAD-dependent epimerase/dehydratase family protein [Candidatus Hodarchaeales archaeon]|jgi:UDP-glucose 4-epimerase